MGDLDVSNLITGKNLLLGGAAFALTTGARETFKGFFASVLGQRLLPLVPLVLCVAGALMGICDGATEWQSRLALGLIVGFAAGHLFKIGKTSIMGAGIEEPVSKDPPTTASGEIGK
jgi:hypothetical protein